MRVIHAVYAHLLCLKMIEEKVMGEEKVLGRKKDKVIYMKLKVNISNKSKTIKMTFLITRIKQR